MKCIRRQFVILSLVAASAFFLTGCTRFINLDPNKLIMEALANLLTVNSVVADTRIAGVTSSDPLLGELANRVAALQIKSYLDQRNPADTKTRLEVVGLDEKGEQILEADIFLELDNLYMKITKLPGDSADTDRLAALLDKDFRLPLSDLGAFLPAGAGLDLLPSGAEKKTLAKVLRKETDLFASIDELDQEEFQGEQVRKFEVKFNKEALTDLAIELARLAGEPITKEEVLLPQNFDKQPFEIWVGLTSKTIVRFKSQIADLDSALAIDIQFGQFNEDLGLAPPENSEELNLLKLMELLGSDSSSTLEVDVTNEDLQNLEEALKTLENLDGTIQIDIGNSTLPGLPNVPFPVQ